MRYNTGYLQGNRNLRKKLFFSIKIGQKQISKSRKSIYIILPQDHCSSF